MKFNFESSTSHRFSQDDPLHREREELFLEKDTVEQGVNYLPYSRYSQLAPSFRPVESVIDDFLCYLKARSFRDFVIFFLLRYTSARQKWILNCTLRELSSFNETNAVLPIEKNPVVYYMAEQLKTKEWKEHAFTTRKGQKLIRTQLLQTCQIYCNKFDIELPLGPRLIKHAYQGLTYLKLDNGRNRIYAECAKCKENLFFTPNGLTRNTIYCSRCGTISKHHAYCTQDMRSEDGGTS